jgi:hypothetical protein
MLGVARIAMGWPLTAVERSGLMHVYGIMPWLPEAADAFDQTRTFLR